MFGGLAFLVGGNMAVAASGQGGRAVRVDPEQSDALIASTGAEPMVMRGRPMRGGLRVDAGRFETEPELAAWVERRRRVRAVAAAEEVAQPYAAACSANSSA